MCVQCEFYSCRSQLAELNHPGQLCHISPANNFSLHKISIELLMSPKNKTPVLKGLRRFCQIHSWCFFFPTIVLEFRLAFVCVFLTLGPQEGLAHLVQMLLHQYYHFYSQVFLLLLSAGLNPLWRTRTPLKSRIGSFLLFEFLVL